MKRLLTHDRQLEQSVPQIHGRAHHHRTPDCTSTSLSPTSHFEGRTHSLPRPSKLVVPHTPTHAPAAPRPAKHGPAHHTQHAPAPFGHSTPTSAPSRRIMLARGRTASNQMRIIMARVMPHGAQTAPTAAGCAQATARSRPPPGTAVVTTDVTRALLHCTAARIPRRRPMHQTAAALMTAPMMPPQYMRVTEKLGGGVDAVSAAAPWPMCRRRFGSGGPLAQREESER